MSKRTAEASQAVVGAWKREQELVREGRGTRDWTSGQQRDILTKGKAYDEDGKAFEGHHMKSVVQYPEYQGDCDNIQFLSRKEHKTAHYGDFHNPTNGYYNPFTGEVKSFGTKKYEPVKVIRLSNPIKKAGNEVTGSTGNKGISNNKIFQGEKSMSKGTVIRDPDEMRKFANACDEYYEKMKKVCSTLKNDMANAAPGMKDRTSKKALQRTEQLIDELLAGLPGVAEVAVKLRKAAEPLERARTIKMR